MNNLIKRIDSHLRQLRPHEKRKTAELLREAKKEIEQLQAEAKRLRSIKIVARQLLAEDFLAAHISSFANKDISTDEVFREVDIRIAAYAPEGK